VRDDAALFCPYCGIELTPTSSMSAPSKKETGFPVAAGILMIVAACTSAIVGIIGMIAFIGSISYSSFAIAYAYSAPYYQLLLVGIFGILGLAFGLTAGIFSLKRKYFALSIVGMYFVFVSGVLTMIAFALMDSSWIVGLPLGLPVVILSILSVIFTMISKGEFV
jgi:hypothetical protein